MNVTTPTGVGTAHMAICITIGIWVTDLLQWRHVATLTFKIAIILKRGSSRVECQSCWLAMPFLGQKEDGSDANMRNHMYAHPFARPRKLYWEAHESWKPRDK